MAKDITELVFILDESGSIGGLESDSIGGYNSMLSKQQALEGECRLTTILFNERVRVLHDRLDIRAVKHLSGRDYCPGGCTALLDAVGCGINKIVQVQKSCSEEYRADKVMFVIITDGLENASRRYSASQIRSMIEHEKEKYGWEFIFLGANIDAAETASGLGIDADRTADYFPDAAGTALNFEAMSDTVCHYRCCGSIAQNGLNRIRKNTEAKLRRKK